MGSGGTVTSVKAIRRRSFGTDVVTLMTGTAIAQVIAIFATPIVTRLYGADAYGVYALFTSLVSILVVIACMRYELSIMLPKTHEEASSVLALCFLLLLIVSIALVPILWFFGDDLSSLLNAPELRAYLWLLPPMVFLGGSFSAINYWNSRKREFSRLSRSQVAKAVTTSGLQLGIGFSGYPSGGTLIIAGVAGQFVATSTLAHRVWKVDGGLLRNHISWRGIKQSMNNYRDFPLYDVWSALINAFSSQVPLFILSAFFSTTVVGYYSLGLMVLHIPISLIGGAVSQVYYQRAAQVNDQNPKALASTVELTIGALFSLGFLPLMMLGLVGVDLFSIVFGHGWSEAGLYSQILSISILIIFIISPVSITFSVQRRLRLFLLFSILILLSRTVSPVIGGLEDDIVLGLVMLTLFTSLAYLLMGRSIMKGTGATFGGMKRQISRPFIIGLGLLIPMAILKGLFVTSSLIIVLVAIVEMALYYVILFYKDESFRRFVSSTLRGKNSTRTDYGIEERRQ